MPAIPLVDVRAELAAVRAEVDRAIARVLDTGVFIGGPEVDAFEAELARRAGVSAAIGTSSGTDSLLVTMMALGIGAGDDVVTTPLSFFAAAGAIARLGAKPVFADVDENLCLDPGRAAAAVGPRTRAVIPVNLFGRPAPSLEVPCPVLEDSAQSLGAGPVRGRAAAVSFYPTKNLGALGDAGAVLTDDAELADTIRLLRTQGARPRHHHIAIGGNFRLDALQAAVLRARLPHLTASIQARRDRAARYTKWLAEVDLPPEVVLPADHPDHVWHHYVIRVPERDAMRAHLAGADVATEVYYPVPLHLATCFAHLGYREGAFPVAEAAARQTLALPISPSLTEDQQVRVVGTIASYYQTTPPPRRRRG